MISVAMTTYNGEKYLREQLDSIMNQSVKVDEIIVCDDGSSDKTLDILKDYPAKVTVNCSTLGFKKNFKKAISLCRGDYIILCDQDDIWEDNKVEELKKQFELHLNMHVCACAFHCIDGNDNFLNNRKVMKLYPGEVEKNEIIEVTLDSLISINYFQGSSMMIDRWIANRFLDDYNEEIEHDWFICMLAASYHSMYFYNKALFQYRIHEKNEIGIPSVNESTESHLQTASKMNIRLQPARNAITVLEILNRVNPEYYNSRVNEFNKLKKFCYEHIDFMEKYNFFGLIRQNFTPYYSKIMTRNARIMDLIFTLKKGR